MAQMMIILNKKAHKIYDTAERLASTTTTKKIFISTVALGILALTSCKTYYMSLDSFKSQFTGIDSTELKDVTVRGPVYETYHYKANPITTIKCVDKHGNPSALQNSPSIETRITYGHSKKRAIFYFDRIYVSDSSLVGVQSRFMGFIRKTIPLDSITKIEVQDGHKKFTYIDK